MRDPWGKAPDKTKAWGGGAGAPVPVNSVGEDQVQEMAVGDGNISAVGANKLRTGMLRADTSVIVGSGMGQVLLDGTDGVVVYTVNGVKSGQIAPDGSGFFGADAGISWDNAGNLTVQAVKVQGLLTAAAIAADNITAGTLNADVQISVGKMYSGEASGPGLVMDTTGLHVYNEIGTQTGEINVSGSGWFGAPDEFYWDEDGVLIWKLTAGSITINNATGAAGPKLIFQVAGETVATMESKTYVPCEYAGGGSSFEIVHGDNKTVMYGVIGGGMEYDGYILQKSLSADSYAQLELHSTNYHQSYAILKVAETAGEVDYWATLELGVSGIIQPVLWIKGDPVGVKISGFSDPTTVTWTIDGATGNITINPTLTGLMRVDAGVVSAITDISQAEQEAGTSTALVCIPAFQALRKIGDGWALGSGGDCRGSGALDLQTVRDADTQVASGANAKVLGGSYNTASGENATVLGGANTASAERATVLGGANNTASGYASTVLGGESNTASGDASIASGGGAVADKPGQCAHAPTMWASDETPGTLQTSLLVAAVTTTDATPTALSLYADWEASPITIAAYTTWAFEVMVVARRTDAADESAAYHFRGCIDRQATTVALVGSVAKTVIAEDDADWDCAVTADDTNKALLITVTGVAAHTIRWVARITLAEVTG